MSEGKAPAANIVKLADQVANAQIAGAQVDPEHFYPEQQRALSYLRRKGTELTTKALAHRLEGSLDALEQSLGALSDEQARRSPGEGWCLQEVTDHLTLSHRPVVDQLSTLLEGRSPEGGAVPAHLISPQPLATPWPAALEALREVHQDLRKLLSRASDEISQEATAPVVMVVRCEVSPGVWETVEWEEQLDWKALVAGIRVHNLEHLGQIGRIVEILDVPSVGN
ncbi:MAG: DinB family protein [Acidobacteriota bacterium]